MGLLLLLLRTILELLVTRREGLCIARQVRLRLRFSRRVARLVLPHVRLAVIVVAVKAFIGGALRLSALATLLRLMAWQAPTICTWQSTAAPRPI